MQDPGRLKLGFHIGALIIRVGFWGILNYKSSLSKEPPEIVLLIIWAPILGFREGALLCFPP